MSEKHRSVVLIALVGVSFFLLGFISEGRDARRMRLLAAAAGRAPGASLIHERPGSNDFSAEGKHAGRLLLDFLESGRRDSLMKAGALYRSLFSREDSWSRYVGLKWLCDYLLASDDARAGLASDRAGARLIRFFSPRSFSLLRKYLEKKCLPGSGAKEMDPQTEAICELVLLSSPLREELDRPREIIRAMGLERGDAIADIGCGAGYWSFLFSEVVGEKGRVYALDMMESFPRYIGGVIREEGIGNITTWRSAPSDTLLEKDSVDLAFLCYLYSGIYQYMDEQERQALITSIRKGLRKGGRLVVHENPPEVEGEVPFALSGISPDLVTCQLEQYGFRLVETHRFSPQAYLLIFAKGGSD